MAMMLGATALPASAQYYYPQTYVNPYANNYNYGYYPAAYNNGYYYNDRRSSTLGSTVKGALGGAAVGALGGLLVGSFDRRRGVMREVGIGAGIGAGVGAGIGLFRGIMNNRDSRIASPGYYWY